MSRQAYNFAVVKLDIKPNYVGFVEDTIEPFVSKVDAMNRLLKLRAEHPDEKYQYVVLPYDRKAGGPMLPLSFKAKPT